MTKLFLSYSRADARFAQLLRAELVRAGHDVWLDVEAIQPSDDWLTSIESGIEHSDVALFLISRGFVRSRMCVHELRYAAAHEKRMLAVIREIVDDIGLPSELEGLDAMEARGHVDFATLAGWITDNV